MNNENKPKTIDDYINHFDNATKDILQKIRLCIHQSVPDAIETISYGMPGFKFKEIIVYFAAWKNHIGFYPTPSGIEKFTHELAEYEISKGAIKFYYNKPIPYNLIEKITKYRYEEILLNSSN